LKRRIGNRRTWNTCKVHLFFLAAGFTSLRLVQGDSLGSGRATPTELHKNDLELSKFVRVDGLTGKYSVDEKLALKAAKMDVIPEGYVWHHH